MALLVSLIYFAMLPAVIAFVLAAVLPKFFPAASYRKRTAGAALGAGCLPMALPVVVLLIGNGTDYGYSPLIPLAAVLFAALIIAVVIGLPAAMLARRGKEPAHQDPGAFD
ncbi:MAG: hypothetical protein ABL914_11970 [Novosphingobium sp.]|uniref:hypothetical protein n=1 Tax=Novosphingobium sp. TaxID=1874826 RepID=UPI0032BB78E0